MTSHKNNDGDGFDEPLSAEDIAEGAEGEEGSFDEEEDYDDEDEEAQSDPGGYDEEEDGEYDDEFGEGSAGDYEYHGGIDQSEHSLEDAGVEDAVAETPQAEFRCVFTKGGSVQGKLLLLRARMVFVPHFFSTARVSLAYASIVQIHKRNTALIFPNAIEFVTADGLRYLFTSFIARDQAYATICTVLRAFTERDHIMEFSVSEHSERLASDTEGDAPTPAPAPASPSPASDAPSPPDSPVQAPAGATEGASPAVPLPAPPQVGSPSASPPSGASPAGGGGAGGASVATASGAAVAAAGLLAVSVPTTPVVQSEVAVVGGDVPQLSAPDDVDVDEEDLAARPAGTGGSAQTGKEQKEEESSSEGVLPEVQEACAKHFSAELHKAPEWKREEVALAPARLCRVLFGAGTCFWHDVYGDMQYTNIACTPWARADGCRCLQRGVEFDTVVSHSLVGTKNCHVRNVQYLTRPAPDVLEFVSQTHMGPELPYSTAYYAEAFVRAAPAAHGATVTIGFRTVFVKSVFVRGIIEKSAIAGLYPLYEKFFARLRAVCDAEATSAVPAAPAPAGAPQKSLSSRAAASSSSTTTRRPRRGRKRTSAAQQDAASVVARIDTVVPAGPPQPAAVPSAAPGGAGAAPVVAPTTPAAPAAETAGPRGAWLRQLVRIVVVPLRTPSLVRDLVAALLLSLLVSGFVTSSLRVQVDAQGAQIAALSQQVAALQARLDAAPDTDVAAAAVDPDGVCPAVPASVSAPTSLREEDIARILAFLGEARKLADTLGADTHVQSPSAPAATRTHGALPQPSKQERWTTVLVAALILVTALVFIFFRSA